jgi:hypothetical protein
MGNRYVIRTLLVFKIHLLINKYNTYFNIHFPGLLAFTSTMQLPKTVVIKLKKLNRHTPLYKYYILKNVPT